MRREIRVSARVHIVGALFGPHSLMEYSRIDASAYRDASRHESHKE